MSGNRPKRGLADFLSRELKGPPAAAEPEVRHSETSEVREKNDPRVTHGSPPAAPKDPVVNAKVAKPSVVAPVSVVEESPKPPAVVPVVVPVHAVVEVESPRAPAVAEVPVAAREEPAVVARVVDAQTPSPADLGEPKSARVTKTRTAEVREPVAAERLEPLYLRLTRKDVRFRDEQLTALHLLARRLSKARRGTRGERITDNTLVRVAVDLLLQHGDELTGADEASLLESLRKLSRKRA